MIKLNLRDKLENVKANFLVFMGIFMALRVIWFEKFSFVYNFFYFFIGALALGITYVLDPFISLGVGIFLLLAYKRLYKKVVTLKYMLIKNGDRIEFSPISEEEVSFKYAIVVRHLNAEAMRKTKKLANDRIEDSDHFYLVTVDKKSEFIDFDTIIAIAPEIFTEDLLA